MSKTEFKEVLSDILIGMAAGLKRDPIVILRIDGEDLLEFISSPSFEPEMVSIFSQIESAEGLSLRDSIIKALQYLTVDQGIPPCSDSWVNINIHAYSCLVRSLLSSSIGLLTQSKFIITKVMLSHFCCDFEGDEQHC